jgi:hypothetical protein
MFEFGAEEIAAMEVIKDLVIRSPALRPLNYAAHEWPMILAVDSSLCKSKTINAGILADSDP